MIFGSSLSNPIILMIVGAAFTLFGLGWLIYTCVIISQNSVVVQGKVVDIKPTKTYRGIFPVFEYVVNGNKIISQTKFSTTSTKFKVGETCTIKYNPKKPYSNHIIGEYSQFITQGCLIVFGIIMIILCIGK